MSDRKSDRDAAIELADTWARMSADCESLSHRYPPGNPGQSSARVRARTLQQCAAELRETMGVVRCG